MKTKGSTQLEQYRQALYNSYGHAADARFELLDALASQTRARSVAELSLEPVFRRGYCSLYSGISSLLRVEEASAGAHMRRQQEAACLHLFAPYVPAPQQRPYWLFATDATPQRRQFARTLQDRGYVYWPNSVAGNKPVTIGHSYSVLAALPEKAVDDPPWVAPLLTRRITTAETETEVAAAHLGPVFGDETLPWHGQLSVLVVDSKHSTPAYLHCAAQYEHLVIVARVRSNRVFHHQHQRPAGERKRGRPRSYGERFALREPESWPRPDGQFETTHTSQCGRVYTVKVQSWHNMLMRGTRACPMHNRPFTLVRIVWCDEQGQAVHKKALWLLVFGQRRQELTLAAVNAAYRQRFDQEHFFRFGKQRLLLTAYQTPEVVHEENWWQLGHADLPDALSGTPSGRATAASLAALPSPTEKRCGLPSRHPARLRAHYSGVWHTSPVAQTPAKFSWTGPRSARQTPPTLAGGQKGRIAAGSPLFSTQYPPFQGAEANSPIGESCPFIQSPKFCGVV